MEGNVGGKWTICGSGANPGRSGSPVLTEDAKAIAVFIERPGEDQDRARVLPVRYLTDLGLDALPKAPSVARPTTGEPVELLYSFSLDYGADGFAGTANGLYVVDDHGIEDISALPLFSQLAKAVGKAVRTTKRFSATLKAQPGYVFQPEEVQFSVASQNPPSAPLPNVRCRTDGSTDCYELSPDQSTITLRLRLFPGALDGARAWLHAAMVTRQIRQKR